jgi:hypothetical protein
MSDNLFLTSTFSNGQVTDEGEFLVSINNGPLTPGNGVGPGHSIVPLPDTPRPLPIRIQLNSRNHHHWDIEGQFEYRGNGNLAVINAPDEFQPPRAVFTGNLPGTTRRNFFSVMVTGFLARVRDTTPTVLAELANVPTGVRNDLNIPAARRHLISTELPFAPLHPWPPSTWKTPNLPNFMYASTPLVAGGQVVAAPQTIAPATVDLVLEVANVNAPKMIAVSWPNAIARTARSGPTPFLIYLHPGMAQNVGRPGFYENNGQKPYPLGWDYLFYGLWRYINYNTDPFTRDPWAKGLVYQMMASGKNAVIVLPMNKSGIESGVFKRAADTEEILNEINAFMFRRVRIFTPPALGRIALGGFSSGVALQQELIGSILASRKLRTLTEVYMFDRGHGVSRTTHVNDATMSAVNSAAAWAGNDPAKIVRFYSQMESSAVTNYRRLVGTNPAAGVSVTDVPGRTVAILPVSAWTGFAAWRSGDHLHQLISATMLTDALRRSGF